MARPSATDRLVRLLALPAWVAEHPGATFDEAANHFQVSPRTIHRDVGTLWVSGLPGGMPDALVDFDAEEFEHERLRLTHPLGLDRPVRLTHEEAVALLLSLRVLVSLLGARQDTAGPLVAAMSALEDLVGGEAHDEPGPQVATGPTAAQVEILSIVQEAMRSRRRLRLDYVSATDARSTRLVDPLELVTDGSRLTLRAWCLTANQERSFRLDRMLSAQLTEQSAQGHVPEPGDGADTQVRPVAHLRMRASGRWLIEQVPYERVAHHEDGTFTVSVRGRDEAWLIGLVLSAGRHLVAVEPAVISARAVATARAALQHY